MNQSLEMYRKQRMGEIATNLRHIRSRVGWTQEQVAEHLGFSRAHVNRVEQGKTEFGVAELEILAQAFNVPLSELI